MSDQHPEASVAWVKGVRDRLDPTSDNASAISWALAKIAEAEDLARQLKGEASRANSKYKQLEAIVDAWKATAERAHTVAENITATHRDVMLEVAKALPLIGGSLEHGHDPASCPKCIVESRHNKGY